ncbi:UvrD-helicase domain-containing protein [Rhizobium ruizarguesonis]|uniref:UvrD-helicase domain-containing protein n=1 Tax=Rhizobium ruizarguesonis TaxID=2081791 RepID=UPI0018D4E3D8|nr:ATP-dependent helicase [Rhizobium ruizarguesonis]
MLQRRRMDPERWEPSGVKALEKNALIVVKSDDNRSVIAGPGAGKTELLAQRASYLLQTGIAKAPQRILAISFKRDAALNLGKRVDLRCHGDLANRFDSMTFDAFAKGLLDRFGQTLPDRWRPTPNYDILETKDAIFRGFLRDIGAPPEEIGTRWDIEEITVKAFERHHLLGSPLPVEGWPNPTPAQWAADRFWTSALRSRNGSLLSFAMIGRLAELVLRLNPEARDALKLTYSHLFMDEFQDTTQIQYDLVKRIFLGSDTVITAVGDNKQQIMRWALAMDDPFAAFEADFGATRTPLFNNYRSSPELVRIQHVLAQALDGASSEPVSQSMSTISDDCCAVWDFTTTKAEAIYLAKFVRAEMEKYSLKPRDFCLIVRQLADNYMPALGAAFATESLVLRNEAAKVGAVMLQELLAEELPNLVVQLLRLATAERAGKHWSECQRTHARLRGMPHDDEKALNKMRNDIDAFCQKFQENHPFVPSSAADCAGIVDAIVTFIEKDTLIAAYPAYRQGDWLAKVIEATGLHLWESCAGQANWAGVLDTFEGLHAVPLMTIHKSKGLEYHTVIFVGLDDDAWWSYTKDTVEGTAGFFVAFTRAKQRVVFTYCAARGQRKKIGALYGLLAAAGVVTSTVT